MKIEKTLSPGDIAAISTMWQLCELCKLSKLSVVNSKGRGYIAPPMGFFARRLALVAVLSFTLGGCTELSARRDVQDGNQAYKSADFDKAAKLFESAIKQVPSLTIAHHNLALARLQIFKKAESSEDRKRTGDIALKAFSDYLQKKPNDEAMARWRALLWEETGNNQAAIAYWMKVAEEDKENTYALRELARFSERDKKWRDVVKWLSREADVYQDPKEKITPYVSIGQSLLNRVRDVDDLAIRREMLDVGIHAMETGLSQLPEADRGKRNLRK